MEFEQEGFSVGASARGLSIVDTIKPQDQLPMYLTNRHL